MIHAGLSEQFPKDCRVSPSEECTRTFLQDVKPWLRRGTVVGYGRDGAILLVKLDGAPKPKPFGAFFWERYR